MTAEQPMDEQALFVLSIGVLVFGLFLTLVLVGFALVLLRRSEHDQVQSVAELQEQIREFWRSYGQINISAVLLLLVTVLLLSGRIDPDAGLPILSGISGFAIAKSTDNQKGLSGDELARRLEEFRRRMS